MEQVLRPKGAYKGQKLTKLVRANTMASTTKTIPQMPEITLVKNNVPITAAIISLMIRSVDPIFFFITLQLI